MAEDKLHEGIYNMTLKNKSKSGKTYELNNLIGNIKVAVERLEEVVSVLDFSKVIVTVKRDSENFDVIVFNIYVKGAMIGDITEITDEDDA